MHIPDVPGIKPSGRPDLICVNPFGPSCMIEVKHLDLHQKLSFPFADINPSQREWLSKYDEVSGRAFLGLGISGIRPREIYLVPWADWLDGEEKVVPHQDSIPFIAGPGFSKALQSSKLDINTLFSPYRLLYLPPKERLYSGESGFLLSNRLVESGLWN
jgi:hypothetical protein